MSKLQFPKKLFVTIGKNPNGNDEWFDAVSSEKTIDISVGEEKMIAEYQLTFKKKVRGVLEEV